MTLSGGPGYPNGSSVVTAPWIARDTQTWLALSENVKKEGRAVGGSKKYVLIPQKQSWNWKDYVINGDVNITLETLPPNTMVLTLDSTAVNLTQEVMNYFKIIIRHLLKMSFILKKICQQFLCDPCYLCRFMQTSPAKNGLQRMWVKEKL